MPDPRTEAYDIETLSSLFEGVQGYYNLHIRRLARRLVELNLLEEANRIGIEAFAPYAKWSFTTSFVELINAWQWFLAGVLLSRQAYLPAQILQMYYYSIFFSFRSFLSGHFKGRYTVAIDTDGQDPRQIRKDVWVDDQADEVRVVVENPSGGGEHRHTAVWFYEVFKAWDLKDNHPTVESFETDQRFHSMQRNQYTYSLADIADELYHDPRGYEPITNDILLCFWRRYEDALELSEYYPEAAWAIEHLRVPMDLHQSVLRETEGSLVTFQQTRLVRSLVEQHRQTGLGAFVEDVMSLFLDEMEARDSF